MEVLIPTGLLMVGLLVALLVAVIRLTRQTRVILAILVTRETMATIPMDPVRAPEAVTPTAPTLGRGRAVLMAARTMVQPAITAPITLARATVAVAARAAAKVRGE